MRYFVGVLLSLVTVLPAAADSIVIDGTLTEAEWGARAVGEVPSEGELFVVREDDALYLGLRAPGVGLVNVYLWRDDELRVLHRSGSLGRAVYRRSDDTWTRTEDFEWRMKNLGPEPDSQGAAVAAKLRAKLGKSEPDASEKRATTPEEIQEAVAGHLAEHGWTATTGPVAAPHSAELMVALPLLGEGWRISVQWMQRNAHGDLEIATWPAGASVGPDEAIWSLVGGSAPEAVRFTPADWRLVTDDAP